MNRGACGASRSEPAAASGPVSGGLSITFFDIGQGDSALITSPAGKRVLIDGGPPESGDRLVQDLRQRGVEGLDLIVLTHPHLDHLGGLTKVVRAFAVKNFLDSGFSHPSPAYTALLKALEERGVAVKQAAAGRKIDIGGGAQLLLYGPPAPYLQGTRSDVNANSVVTRLSFGQAVALFPGDAEPETERWLLSQGVDLSAGLLKVPHHGGRYSSTAEFLRAVGPRIAVISVGARNDYGHPTREAMGRLVAAGARLYRTDQSGDVTVTSDGKGWKVEGSPQTATMDSPAPARRSETQEDGTGGAGPAAARGQGGSAGPAARGPGPAQAGGGDGERVASKRAAVFHVPSCAAVGKMKPENVIRFPNREAALASGRRPREIVSREQRETKRGSAHLGRLHRQHRRGRGPPGGDGWREESRVPGGAPACRGEGGHLGGDFGARRRGACHCGRPGRLAQEAGQGRYRRRLLSLESRRGLVSGRR